MIRGVTVSTLTRAIDRLEDELGVTLLDRSRAGIRLTTVGNAIIQGTSSLLDELHEIQALCQMFGTGRRGVVRIGSLFPPVSGQFRLALSVWKKRNPDVGIVFYEMGTQDLRSALFRNRLEVIFFTSYVRSESIESLPFFSENLVLALPSEHPLSRCRSLTRNELRNQTFLIQDWGQDYSVRRRYNDVLGKDVTIETHPAGKQSVFALVSAGYGLTLAAQSQAENGFPGVVFRPLRERDAHLQIRLGWAANRQDAATGRFVAFIRDFIRQS